tara:strand:+ start:651 stop:827 length:177 start_codon:yes stop_codon:yes gene_type:complete
MNKNNFNEKVNKSTSKFPSNIKMENKLKNIGIVMKESKAHKEVKIIDKATFPCTSFVA